MLFSAMLAELLGGRAKPPTRRCGARPLYGNARGETRLQLGSQRQIAPLSLVNKA